MFFVAIPSKIDKENVVKTKLALAISAALITNAIYAETPLKFNTTGQDLSTINGKAVNLKKEKRAASAWMVKLKTPSVSQQTRTFKRDSKIAVSLVKESQEATLQRILSIDSEIKVIEKTKILANSIIINATEATLETIQKFDEVESVLPLYDYELHVAESAEYIKAADLVATGTASGQGQRVAILDTGVDYTHKAIGGTGDPEDYQAATEAHDQPVNWPQGRVIGGYDFINDDPNPIDADTNHGTHVSHSVLGISPDVELYVYSVCGGGCPGLAQFRALEAAMDPNGDGDISDRVDTVNMSLGGDFGDIDGGAVQVLIDEMVELGVNLVISAGNDGPTPFIVGGPSTSNNALSVGAMTHPNGVGSEVSFSVAGDTAEAIASSFNPSSVFSFDQNSAPLIYPDMNKEGCDAFDDAIDFTGQAVIIDRGSCAFTTKVLNAQAKGASLVIIANNTAGELFPGGGADGITIPSVGITQELGLILKDQILNDNQNYSISSTEYDDSGAIATFTSRGPSIAGTLKPEITAPGTAIETAEPGLGDGLTPISGTSFSGPITAGALSLIREAHPNRTAFEIKATAMNTANLEVYSEPKGLNSGAELAPISYIGAGLVDAEKAVNSEVIAWNAETNQAALAFGLLNVTEPSSFTKTITVKNFSSDEKTFTLRHTPRYQSDTVTGAISFELPATITVPANSHINFGVKLNIDPSKLPEWGLHSALIGDLTAGTTPLSLSDALQVATDELTRIEFDGSIDFMAGADKAFHLVYHALPKAADKAEIEQVNTQNGSLFFITNTGNTVIDRPFSASLIASDPIEPNRRHDLTAGSTELLANANCASGYMVTNTIQVRDNFLHTLPASYQVDFDINNDGFWDYSSMTGREEWFTNTGLTGLISFNRIYGSGRGVIAPAIHNSGNNFVTTLSCSEHLGISDSMINEQQTITIRYRIEDFSYSSQASGEGDMVEAELVLAPSTSSVTMMSLPSSDGTTNYSTLAATGTPITSLQPGETAILNISKDANAKGVMLLTDTGNLDLQLEDEDNPVIRDATFDVNKGAQAGTVLGQLYAQDGGPLPSNITNFVTVSSTSPEIEVNSKGEVVVAQGADINQTTDTITLIVQAEDSAGNLSGNATVTVTVNNIAPTVELEDRTVRDLETITLTANGLDDDSDNLTYKWTQLSTGEQVTFSQNEESITFETPSGSHELEFEVEVTDDRESAKASAIITVEGNNLPSVTLTDTTARDKEMVTLIAAATDADDDELTYEWSQQSSGSPASFTQEGNRISFVTPSGNNTLSFSVKVSDGRGETTATSTVNVIGNNLPTITLEDVSTRDMETVNLSANVTDTDSDSLTYTWNQTAGTPVQLTQDGTSISFVSPAGNHELKFALTANDGRGETTATSTVNVIGNNLPTITLEDVSVRDQETVILAATVTDSDNDALAFSWTQTAGEEVEFEQSNNQITFIAPNGSHELEFALTVNDARQTATATSKVTILGNSLPTLTVQGTSVTEGSEVTLTAIAEDTDNDELTYTWTQMAGDTVEFTADGDSISFTAPAGAGSYDFSVTANDGRGDSAAATATVTVTAVPAPEPTPEPESSSSSGSLGWLALILAPMAFLRRRNK